MFGLPPPLPWWASGHTGFSVVAEPLGLDLDLEGVDPEEAEARRPNRVGLLQAVDVRQNQSPRVPRGLQQPGLLDSTLRHFSPGPPQLFRRSSMFEARWSSWTSTR